jgi:tryptophanyl-tRNA synthetase
MTANNRIVSGMRPTGPLHLGHYFGVLVNWIHFHKDSECLFFVADWHALTTEYADPRKIKGFVPELVKDWVASGLDPNRCVMFQQSQIKEHAELNLLLSMITPVSWLERNPTYKDVRDQLDGTKDLSTFGFLGYPVLMASDIIIYNPKWVPVGQDQLPHLEITREIARRANHLWGDTFVEPEAKLTTAPRLPGLDGRKMSKSYGNAIYLGEDPETIRKKVTGMVTCTRRVRLKDPGEPDECNLFPYHQLLTPAAEVAEIACACRAATIGCGDCKKKMFANLLNFLEPMQARRAEFDKDPDLALDILRQGNEKAREAAGKTMAVLRERLNFNL